MNTILNDFFARFLSKELFWQLLSTIGTDFSNDDFASCLIKVIPKSEAIHLCDGVFVITDTERYRAIVQTIYHPHSVRHFRMQHFLPLRDDGKQSFSGRNSPDYSFGEQNVHAIKENKLGAMVLGIWNARLAEVRKRFSTTRTVVLIKGEDLSTVAVFEEESVMFLPEEYEWEWNQKGNLEGYFKGTDVKRFTWQPHGSQFTITTNVPENRLKLRIKRPPLLDREEVLTQLKFDPSWIEVVK